MREKLLALLEDIRPDLDFENEERLIDDGILDSFDIISIVSAIEETFNISIDVEELESENFNSLNAMINYISKG